LEKQTPPHTETREKEGVGPPPPLGKSEGEKVWFFLKKRSGLAAVFVLYQGDQPFGRQRVEKAGGLNALGPALRVGIREDWPFFPLSCSFSKEPSFRPHLRGVFVARL